MKIIKYRGYRWWKFIHYNYFHKQLFKKYYVRKKILSPSEIKKYKRYIIYDNLITLRNIRLLRLFIWRYTTPKTGWY